LRPGSLEELEVWRKRLEGSGLEDINMMNKLQEMSEINYFARIAAEIRFKAHQSITPDAKLILLETR